PARNRLYVVSKAAPISFQAAVVLALAAQLSVNAGSGFAVRAFEVTGPAAMVLLRNGIAAVVVLALIRPKLNQVTRRGWMAVGAYGLALAGMNSLFYEAIDLIPVGPAVTIEMLGPLALSVVLARQARAWLWAGTALVGVLMLSGFDLGGVNLVGAGLVLAAGACWAAYILAARWVGREFASADGLALGFAVAGLLSVPRGIGPLVDSGWSWQVAGWGLLVAMLGTLVPYWLEMWSLRGMPASVFGVMTAVAPASAALFGWLIAGQGMTWWIVGGMAMVTAASAGASLTRSPGQR
ncbi:MAG: EamA family transporter, partial [Bifidobacteriaceae bacterium]|nr:EamA family transporter [Bifidobacteriaceae bacterium]